MISSVVTLVSIAFSAIVAWYVAKIVQWFFEFRAISRAVRDVGSEEYHWFFGHSKKWQPTQQSLLGRSRKLTQKFPKCFKAWYGPVFCSLISYHPHLLQQILAEDHRKDFGYEFMRPWIGDGLLLSYGSKWKRNRRLLTPVFHFEALKEYVNCTNEAATEMLDKWSSNSDSSRMLDVTRDISLMALDNILQCIMSKKSGCQQGQNSQYLQAVRNLTEIAIERMYNPLYQIDVIFYMTEAGRTYKKTLEIAHQFTECAILERKSLLKSSGQSDSSSVRFLDRLLLAKDENGVGLTLQEIRDEVNTFVFEGHDTVTSALSFAFYNLAKYTEYQEKCRSEVIDVLGEKNTVSWGDLSKFSYLTMFIKESMRLCPPVYSIARRIAHPFVLERGFGHDQNNLGPDASPKSSRTLPKGINISSQIFFLHRNPHIWKDPEVFDPERFTAENIAKRSPHCYLPFSSGPRNCIGQNFAMNEIKIVLALALTRYRFSVDSTCPEPEIQPSVVLRSKTGICVKVNKL